jgi:ElaA protein
MQPAISFQCLRFQDLSAEQVHDVFQLRTEVFIVEQNCPYQDFDGLDPGALHLLGYSAAGGDDDGGGGAVVPATPRLLCYARLLARGTSYPEHAAIGRVITRHSVRGIGLGRVLMLEALRHVDAQWASPPLRLGAQDYAIPFYERLGFQCLEHRYLEDGIPHTTMERVRPPE